MLSIEVTDDSVRNYLDTVMDYKNFPMFQRLLSIDDKEQYRTIMKGLINDVITPNELINLKAFTDTDLDNFIKTFITFNDFEKFIGVSGYNMASFYSIVTDNAMSSSIHIASQNENSKIRPFYYFLKINLFSSYYSAPSLNDLLNDIKTQVDTDLGYSYNDKFYSLTEINNFNTLVTTEENSLVKSLYKGIYYATLEETYDKVLLNIDKYTSVLYRVIGFSKYLLNHVSPLYYRYFMYNFSTELNGANVSKTFLEDKIQDLFNNTPQYISNPILYINRIKFIIELAENYENNTVETINNLDKLTNVYNFLANLRDEQEEWVKQFFLLVRDNLNGDFPLLPSNEEL